MVASSGYAGSSDGASEALGVVGLKDSKMLVRREEARDSGGVSDERRLGRLVLRREGEVTCDEDEEERLLDNLTCKVGGAPAMVMSNGQCCDSSRAGKTFITWYNNVLILTSHYAICSYQTQSAV
jgi:hypothetical protein